MEDKIKEWKEKYEELYAVNILDEIYYYRPLNREEYKKIFFQNLEISEYQEEIAKAGTLYPEEIDFEIAGGLAESLCTLILDCSYLNDGQAKYLLNEYRKEMLIFDNQADCLIHEAFPEYKLDDIQNFTVKKTLYMLSRAEYILREFRGVPIAHIGMDEETENEIENAREQIEKNYQEVNNFKEEDIKEENINAEDKMSFPELKWFEAYDDLTGEYE